MKKNNLLPIITKNKNILKYISLMGQIGFLMVFAILISFFIFYFLGKKLDLLQIFIPLGVLIGVFAGFYAVYKLLKKFFIEKEADEEDR